VFIAHLSAINPEEVKAEWRTQIDKFVSIVGHAPDHLDSHHHVSYFTPELFKVMLELAQTYGCAIRLPVGERRGAMLAGIPKGVVNNNKLEQYQFLLRGYQPRCPDQFIIEFYDEGVTEVVLTRILTNLKEGVTEVMCHPAYVDGALSKVAIYTRQREVEFGLLTQPSLRKHIHEIGIELINFGQLS
jgi:predicted glycoside hydrolase/deacetylase ChbG (UPF0249 family)